MGLNDPKYNDEYLNDESVEKDFRPTNADFEHNDDINKEESKQPEKDLSTCIVNKKKQTTWLQILSLLGHWLVINPNIEFK